MTIENSPAAQDSPLPASNGVWQKEAEIYTDDGVVLAVRSAVMTEPIKADVLLVHGLGEHSGRYGHVAAALAGRGLRMVAWDLRGHGRSSGARGDAERHAVLVQDLAQVAAHFTGQGRPWFLFAHSLGGQLALRYLEKGPADCVGAVVFAPWLRLAFDPPWWKLVLARTAMRVWPSYAQKTGNVWERLSRDTTHLAALPDPDLVHHRISARLYFALRAEGEAVLADANRLQGPLLLLHGEDDPITCIEATRELFEQARCADKSLRTYPGVRHEIHNDVGRQQVLAEVADWMIARVAAGG